MCFLPRRAKLAFSVAFKLMYALKSGVLCSAVLLVAFDL